MSVVKRELEAKSIVALCSDSVCQSVIAKYCKRKRVGCTSTGRAHRPRALPLTAGLSDNVGSATIALSVFDGEH